MPASKIVKAHSMNITFSDGSRAPIRSLQYKVVEKEGDVYTVFDTRGGRPAFRYQVGVNGVTEINFE